MKKLLIVAVVIATLLLCQAASAVDATSAWNTYCGAYHFAPYPQTSTTTFAAAYDGSNLASDFAAMKALVGSSVQNIGGGIGNNDLLNASLENWH